MSRLPACLDLQDGSHQVVRPSLFSDISDLGPSDTSERMVNCHAGAFRSSGSHALKPL
jgi:hypothetical protein